MTQFHANHISNKMHALGIAIAQLAWYSGVNANRISPFLSGQRDLSNTDLVRVNDTLADLEKLIAVAQPWPLDIRNIRAIQPLIDQMKAGQLDTLINAMHDAQAAVNAQ